MANKKVSQLVSKPSVLVTDLFPIADPTTGQLFKTTISDLGTAIGSGVSSVNTLVGAVVLDTDDIQELASPTNRWFTDTRARAALSAGTGISYNSGTGVITNAVTSGLITTALGYTPADDALVVKLAGSQTITGTKTFQQAPLMDIGIGYKNGSGVYNFLKSINTGWEMPVNGQNHNLIFSTSTNYVYTFPNASGTIALTSDLTPYALDSAVVKLTGNQTVAGIKTMSNVFKLDDTLQIKNIAQLSNNTGYTGVWAETAAIGFYTGANAIRLLYAGNYNYTMPSSDGTLALTSQLSAYLPLGGGTMTGALFATSASFSGFVGFGGNTSPLAAIDVTGAGIFSSSVRSSGYYLTGMTAGSGALYYNSGANRVTVANYNASGIVTFEVNGGSTALTLNSNLSASFASTLSATGATLTGALNGTSASFNSTLTTTGGTRSIQLVSFASDYNYIRSNGAQLVVGTQDSQDLFIQTNNTTRLTLVGTTGAATFSSSVTATQIAIGTTSPATFLHVNGATAALPATSGTSQSAGNRVRLSTAAGTGILDIGCAGGIGMWLQSTDLTDLSLKYPLLLNPNGGNVGIGTTAPTVAAGMGLVINGGAVSPRIALKNNASGDASTDGFQLVLTTENEAVLENRENASMRFLTNATEAMRITSAGSVLVGTTSTTPVSSNISGISLGNAGQLQASTDGRAMLLNRFSDGTLAEFHRGGTSVGSISVTTVMTSYNVTSDYRLKEDLKPINGLDIVNKIKVYDYKWKADNSRMDGVLAHELAEVLPYAVTGEKDGEQMQGVDYSKIVPVLIQAIKDQQVQIEQLKNK